MISHCLRVLYYAQFCLIPQGSMAKIQPVLGTRPVPKLESVPLRGSARWLFKQEQNTAYAPNKHHFAVLRTPSTHTGDVCFQPERNMKGTLKNGDLGEQPLKSPQHRMKRQAAGKQFPDHEPFMKGSSQSYLHPAREAHPCLTPLSVHLLQPPPRGVLEELYIGYLLSKRDMQGLYNGRMLIA